MNVTFAARLFLVCACTLTLSDAWGAELRAGFGKADITPDRPLRLSGYGNRTEVFERVEQKLWTRALALEDGGKLHLLVATDTIGFPRAVTLEIAARLERELKTPRERLVLSGTHSHTSPQLAGGILNIFAKPMTEDEAQQTERYTKIVADRVVEACTAAVKDLAPAEVSWGQTKVGFAVNRRVLKEGKWTGFGVTDGAPVDHSLPVLRVTSNGKLRGLVYNYACHCTTLGPDFNQISADWAGYACDALEAAHPGTTVLGVIGCGADANPNPRQKLADAQAHGKALSDAVQTLVKEGTFVRLTAPLATSFGEARLKLAPYSRAELETRAAGKAVQAKRHAEHFLSEKAPIADYPCPVHVWRFGDQLTMIFLGGEVVVDYALRLKKELAPQDQAAPAAWVSAYCDDVFAYVASERVRREGGYEVDGSMIYYNLPGPWAEGTEDALIKRIHELVQAAR